MFDEEDKRIEGDMEGIGSDLGGKEVKICCLSKRKEEKLETLLSSLKKLFFLSFLILKKKTVTPKHIS